MLETRVSSNVTLGDIEIPAMELHRAYARSEYGIKLAQNTRYTPYKPESVSNAEWKHLLGADVNNLDHLGLSIGLARNFLDHCANPRSNWEGRPIPPEAQLTSEDQNDVVVTLGMHDWAEVIVGDIPYHQKSKSDAELELELLPHIIHDVLRSIESNIKTEPIIEKVVNILNKQNRKLHPVVDAIERQGYMRTSLRSARVMNRPGLDEERSTGLKGVAVTGPYHFIELREYGEIYPATDAFLGSQKRVIGDLVSLADKNRTILSEENSNRIDTVVSSWTEYDARTSILLPHGEEVFITTSN